MKTKLNNTVKKLDAIVTALVSQYCSCEEGVEKSMIAWARNDIVEALMLLKRAGDCLK